MSKEYQLHVDVFVPFHERHKSQQYSVFSKWDAQTKQALLLELRHPKVERAVGALMGMVMGDSLGAPLEFLSITERGETYFSLEDFEYTNAYNRFRLKPGQWTDDASMGLCLADSLLVCDGFDGSDLRRRFWKWWYRGYNNAFRFDTERHKKRSVGLGGNIGKSLFVMKTEPVPPVYIPPLPCDDSGNGSLMRLAPLPVFFHF